MVFTVGLFCKLRTKVGNMASDLRISRQKQLVMTSFYTQSNRVRGSFWEFLPVLAGIVLIISVSCEILHRNRTYFSHGFLVTQLLVCLVFMIDYFVRAVRSADNYYALRTLPYLLLSLPYLNIISWSGVTLDRSWMMVFGIIPLLRALVAGWIVVRWFSEKGVRRMFSAYALTVVLFTYLSALVFYDYEVTVNPHLHGFGNAVWWAFMSMTTVGAEIFPVTAIGKILAVVLPALGMLMLPLFTVYVADLYKSGRKSGQE